MKLLRRTAIVLGVLAVPYACRSATQMTVEVRLFGDLPCESIQGIAIVVKRTREEAEAALVNATYTTELSPPTCTAGSVGTLVITPDGDDGAIVVAARLAGVESCKPPAFPGCIIARRFFHFIASRALRIPITLEARCVDLPCDAASSCVARTCAPSDVDCAEDLCTSAAEPVVGPDGGSVVPEGGVVVPPPDASRDGASDGSADAPVDGPGNDGGSSGVGTNLCQLNSGETDCFLSGQTCCDTPRRAFACLSAGGCTTDGSSFNYDCLGRAHCPADTFCCASLPPADRPSQSECQPSCSPVEQLVLCRTDADCPAGKTCTSTYVPLNQTGGTGLEVKACTL